MTTDTTSEAIELADLLDSSLPSRLKQDASKMIRTLVAELRAQQAAGEPQFTAAYDDNGQIGLFVGGKPKAAGDGAELPALSDEQIEPSVREYFDLDATPPSTFYETDVEFFRAGYRRGCGAALVSAAAGKVEAVRDEAGWLIEHNYKGAPTSWLCVGSVMSDQKIGYTQDASMALRFARRKDAEAFLALHLGRHAPKWYSDLYSVTEHMWVDATPPAMAPKAAEALSQQQIDEIFATFAGQNEHGVAYLRAYLDVFTNIVRAVETAQGARRSRLEAEAPSDSAILSAMLRWVEHPDSTDENSVAELRTLFAAPKPAAQQDMDDKLDLELLPPIRVDKKTAGMLHLTAKCEGIIVQALVRQILVDQMTLAPMAAQQAGSLEDERKALLSILRAAKSYRHADAQSLDFAHRQLEQAIRAALSAKPQAKE